MLSLFPDLFSYQFFAPSVLRFALGAALVFAGISLFRERSGRGLILFESVGLRPAKRVAGAAGIFEAAAGALLVIGFLTQGAAAAAALVGFTGILARIHKPHLVRSSVGHYILILGAAASLLLLGPGALSVDLPL